MATLPPEAPCSQLPRRWLCLGLFGLAALPRVLYLLLARPAFDLYHWALADNLLQRGLIGTDDVKSTAMDVLYPIFLAGARLLSGDRALFVQLLQIAVDSAGAVGLYFLVDALTGRRRAGLFSAALYAFHPLLIRHSVVGDEFSLLSVLLIAFAYTVVTGVTLRRAAVAGLCLGLAILTRFTVAPLVVLTAALFTVTRGATAALVFVLAAVAVVSPWMIRNYAVNGSLWPARSGLNLFIGNSTYTAAVLPDYNIDVLGEYSVDVVARNRPELLDPTAEMELDRYYMTLAFEEVRARPLRALRLVLAKAAYFFWPRLVPSRLRLPETSIVLLDEGQVHVENSPTRPISEEIAYTASYMLIAAAALAGMWVRRSRLRRDAILWCIVLTFVTISAIYIPATRYRVPMEFVLLFYAAVALDALPLLGSGTHWRRMAGQERGIRRR